ncbi:MAG: hypothetical protein R2939_05470 [Kofleriaceae bacterium]
MKQAGLMAIAATLFAGGCEKKAAPAAGASPAGSAAAMGSAVAAGSAAGAATPPSTLGATAGSGDGSAAAMGSAVAAGSAAVPAAAMGSAAGGGLEARPVPADTALPKNAPKGAALVEGVAFTDSAGENLALLTRRGKDPIALVAYHVVRDAAGGERVLREVKDQADCSDDGGDAENATGYRPGSLRVTDLDGDGVGEVSFTYDVGCRYGDAELTTGKTLVLEGGDKYIIRVEPGGDAGYGGDVGYGGGGGRPSIEPAADKWPEAFLTMASERAGL